MHENLKELFKTRTVYDPDGSPHDLHSNISERECEELFDIVKARAPQYTVEVGLANGVSALTILLANQQTSGAIHHAIDPFQRNYHYCGVAMAKRLGLDAGFVFHEKFPDEVIPRLGPLDFAFIDASHLFDLTLMEFVLVDRKLKVGGVVGFHDLWMPSLQKLVRFILGNRSYRLINRRPLPPVSLPKRLVLRALNSNQKFQRYFSRNLLDPFSAMGIPNLVLFEKMQDDQRDWRHFADF